MRDNPWEKFFDRCAPNYLSHGFTRATEAEVDFFFDELKLAPGMKLLDVGCGVGRHATSLALRGIHVTGIDLSNGMLEEARRSVREKNLTNIEFIHADATNFVLPPTFDHAICLCEGAFTLIGEDSGDPFAHDAAILRNIHHALKPGGRFVLTAMNALRAIRATTEKDIGAGKFDPITLIERSPVESGDASVIAPQRHYVPSELSLLLRMCGFEVENIWGGTAGNWGRRPVELDEIELMVIARKRTACACPADAP